MGRAHFLIYMAHPVIHMQTSTLLSVAAERPYSFRMVGARFAAEGFGRGSGGARLAAGAARARCRGARDTGQTGLMGRCSLILARFKRGSR